MKMLSKRKNFCFAGLMTFAIIINSNSLNAAWNPIVTIQPDMASYPFDFGPKLSLVNNQNNAVAVWGSLPPSGNIDFDLITASSYTAGLGWSAPVFISPLTGFNSVGDPAVALNNNGYAVAVYEAQDNTSGNKGLFSATRSSDGTWSGMLLVTTTEDPSGDFDPEGPYVSINDSGLAVATWGELRSDDTFHVMANFLPMGGTWGSPVTLSSPSQLVLDDAPISAMNQNGDIVVVWREERNTQISAATFSHLTNAWTSVVLETLPLGGIPENTAPKVGIDDNGNAVAVWNRVLNAGTLTRTSQVVSSSFTANVGWGPVVVITTMPINVLVLDTVDVVVDHFGNATAVWDIGDPTTETFASSLPFGGSWSPPVLISTEGGGFLNVNVIDRPIAVDNSGNVIVMITQDDNNMQSILWCVQGGWQPPVNIANVGPVVVTNIGIGSCGFALALWLKPNDVGFPFQGAIQASDNFSNFCPSVANNSLGLSGFRCCDKFATQTVCFDVLSFIPNPCFVSYLLFSDGQLIATLSPAQAENFLVQISNKKIPVTYTLIGVTALGGFGPPSVITLP